MESAGTIHRSAKRAAAPQSDPSEAFASATSGSAHEVPYRAEMERSFGEDFSTVKAHTGTGTHDGLEALGARAATQGESIAFREAPSRELVAHELTHVVQQRRSGGGAAPQGKAAVSEPGDDAEREADTVAAQIASGQPVSVQVQAAPSIHRDIMEGGSVTDGDFRIEMRSFEKKDGFSGEEGWISFDPNDAAPAAKSIRLTQIVKLVDNAGANGPEDVDWANGEEDRNKMRTSDTLVYTTVAGDTLKTVARKYYGDESRYGEIAAHKGNKKILTSKEPDAEIAAGTTLSVPGVADGGYFVDHETQNKLADPRKKKKDKRVPEDYHWPNDKTDKTNKHGFKKKNGDTEPAVISDRIEAKDDRDFTYSFQTAARSDDIGHHFGTVQWGFDLKQGKVENEHANFEAGATDTLRHAVAEFNTFYKNTHVVYEGETLERIAARYGMANETDKIYEANKAVLKKNGFKPAEGARDTTALPVGIELALPGISAGIK